MSIARKLIKAVSTSDNISIASISYGINGYIKFTNGMKIVWGKTDAINLKTYKNLNYYVSYTYKFTSSIGLVLAVLINHSSNPNVSVVANQITKNGFQALIDKVSSVDPEGTGEVAYIAIGADTI